MMKEIIKLKNNIKIYNNYQLLKSYESKLNIQDLQSVEMYVKFDFYEDKINNKCLYQDIYLLLYIEQLDNFLEKIGECNHIQYNKYKQYINPTVYQFLVDKN